MVWNPFGKTAAEKEADEAREINKQIVALELELEEKLNPAQESIVQDQGSESQYTSRYTRNHINAYNTLEVVNRGVNIIADAVGEFTFDIKDKIPGLTPVIPYMRPARLNTLINFKSSQYIASSELKRQITVDLLLEGNAFIYFDGQELYSLPAINVEIIPDTRNYIKEYIYDDTHFKPEEIIHIRENAADSIFRGVSRLTSAVDSIAILQKMNTYQFNFFKNNTILGVVLTIPDMLSNKLKNRKVLEWMRDYNPTQGGRKPLILDGGMKIEDLSKYSFKDLDFGNSILTQEQKILEALGVPPILLNSGNNANIAPNQKLLYTNTVLPIVQRIATSLELYFGYDLKPVIADVIALRPELKDEASYYSVLVNAGIMTRNEAREKLRLEPYTGDPKVGDALILPANVAGSAQDPGVGGRPTEDTEE
jgi:HK97 family phage portal protein